MHSENENEDEARALTSHHPDVGRAFLPVFEALEAVQTARNGRPTMRARGLARIDPHAAGVNRKMSSRPAVIMPKLMMPFTVKKAVLTLARSSGRTIQCS